MSKLPEKISTDDIVSINLRTRANILEPVIVHRYNLHAELVAGLETALNAGRGVSGRIILEYADEEVIRALLLRARAGEGE